MTSFADVIRAAEQLWPPQNAEEWDTPGLQVGNPYSSVSHVLLAVDITPDVIREALARGCDAIIAHHPLLLRGITSVNEREDKGHMISMAIKNNLNVYSAHTNADVVANGVSDVIAQALALTHVSPLEESAPGEGLGRVGSLPEPARLDKLVDRVAKILPYTVAGVKYFGPEDAHVSRISLCGGAGDSFLSHPDVLSADVYITSDLRHHPALDARMRAEIGNGPWLIDISHWAAESLWLTTAREQLATLVPECHFSVSALSTDPWQHHVNVEHL